MLGMQDPTHAPRGQLALSRGAPGKFGGLELLNAPSSVAKLMPRPLIFDSATVLLPCPAFSRDTTLLEPVQPFRPLFRSSRTMAAAPNRDSLEADLVESLNGGMSASNCYSGGAVFPIGIAGC